MQNLMVTGGAGFIGSNFVRYMLDKYPDYRILVYDKLTYAGNLDNLLDVDDDPRYTFVQADICDAAAVTEAIQAHDIDTIVNFAAESHVDRSIMDPDAFIKTDVYGTYVLLEAARQLKLERYHQISTDEVYGHIHGDHRSLETDAGGAAQPLRGQQDQRRPDGRRLSRDLRPARDHHPRGQQHRAVPVPGEGHPALRHQRHRRSAAAGVRRRQAAPRLSARAGSLRRDRRGAAQGPDRRDLQRRHRRRDGKPDAWSKSFSTSWANRTA